MWRLIATVVPSAIVTHAINTLNDTLRISSNDTLLKICLDAVGIGAPSATVDSTSLTVNASGCNDTITVPVYVKNINGLAPLDFNIEGATTGSGTIEILTWTNGVDYSGEFANVKSILSSNLTNYNLTETSSNLLKPI